MVTKDVVSGKNRPSLGRPKDPAKREGIVRAASALFLKQGYELTSMEAVAKAAEVSKLTIYSHFANKTELFKEVIQQRCDKLAGPESFMTLAKLPVKQALIQLGDAFVALIYNSDSIHLQRTIYAEAIHHPQVVKIFYEAGPQRVKQAFGELLSEWDRQGQLSVPDKSRATEQFFSLLKGEVHIKAMMLLVPNLSAEELNEHVRATVSLFLAAYQPKTAAGVP